MSRRRHRTPRMRSGRERSQRQLKMGEEIRHIIAGILLRETFHEPALESGGGVTITEVSVSPDLANADVYFVPPRGGDDHGLPDALMRIAPQLGKALAARLTSRRTPRLRFVADTTLDNANRIESIIAANSRNTGAGE